MKAKQEQRQRQRNDTKDNGNWDSQWDYDTTMSLLPIFLKLEGRPCLLVGAGTVALEKIGTLLKTGVRLRVVAPEAREEIRDLAAEGKLEWVQREFEPADLDGNFIVIAATDVPEVNAAVYREAVARGIPSQQRGRHSQLRLLFWLGGEPRRFADCDFDGGREPGGGAAAAARD